MAGKRFRAEQIIMKLREAEVGLAQGQRVGQVSKQMGVSEQTYYRWRMIGLVALAHDIEYRNCRPIRDRKQRFEDSGA